MPVGRRQAGFGLKEFVDVGDDVLLEATAEQAVEPFNLAPKKGIGADVVAFVLPIVQRGGRVKKDCSTCASHEKVTPPVVIRSVLDAGSGNQGSGSLVEDEAVACSDTLDECVLEGEGASERFGSAQSFPVNVNNPVLGEIKGRLISRKSDKMTYRPFELVGMPDVILVGEGVKLCVNRRVAEQVEEVVT